MTRPRSCREEVRRQAGIGTKTSKEEQDKGGVQKFIASSFFLIKQLVVNSKKIGGSAAGQTKRIEKNRSLLVFFEYSINHNNRTSVEHIFPPFCFPGFERTNKIPDLFFLVFS